MIDLDLEGQHETRYSQESGWKSVASFDFLVHEKSHPIFKSFWVPYFSHQRNSFAKYHLFRNTNKIASDPQ